MKFFGNIASVSQTHHFHKFYIHISLSTHTPGGIAKPVAFYWLVPLSKVLNSNFGSGLRLKKQKMAKIWENRASLNLSNCNISQNLHRYFTLYGISCWRATCSWFGASCSSFMPFINSFGSIERSKDLWITIILKPYILNVPFQQYNVSFLFYCVM